MIIIVCTDDDRLEQRASHKAQHHPQVFGQCYRAFRDAIPQLGRHEDLFIGAHGAYHGDDNNPVIGDAHAALYVNAVDFYANIAGIFPADYDATVYIYACEAADYKHGALSFAEVFRAQLDPNVGRARVFAQKGGIGVEGVVGPDADGWIKA